MRTVAPSCPVYALILALALAAAALAPGAEARIRNTERVSVDGAELFLQVRGPDRHAPVVLWLHGGPGGAERPLFRLFNGALERHVVSAYLDQRGAGHSFDPEADPRRLTVATHLEDLDRVVEHLQGDFDGRPLVLLGHSWGGALALLYAARRPQAVQQVIAVAPLVATGASWQAEFEFVHTEARRRDDAMVLEALAEVGPPPYASTDAVLAVERLADRYGAVFHQPPCRLCVLARGVARGLAAPWHVPGFIRGNQVSLRAMHDELAGLDLFEQIPAVGVPVTFLLGRFDRHVSSDIAAAYADVLDAPQKRVVWFEHSAHNPPFEEPQRFHDAVLAALEDFAAAPDYR